ncbi:uncharacterized protein LOC125215484 [Salvia hispanica]|uniref:uncharacterized protein LOC125215484 n=1 Tax=Salvia hispanica TaxID=49212 RepID=UPI0020090672|nr:uncharacterized protein LOC125215484 [Salvia hispanica]XP_047972865.1 uncharacterized protein LOC125215484 [Salvia hispanica]
MFPEDLIFEILGRVGEKDLILLKSVSKGWNFVISKICIPRMSPPSPAAPFWSFLLFKDPLPPEEGREVGDPFLKLHYLLMYHYVYKQFRPPRFRLDKTGHLFPSLLPDKRDHSGIRDCCNGILLLASSSQYYVANPVTKQRISIPINPQHHHTDIKTMHSSFVFDPSLSLDFKIVAFTAVNLPLELDIFCSEMGQWRSHVLPLEPHDLHGCEWLPRSIYFNRGLYSLSLAMFLVCIDNLLPSPSDLRAWAVELPDKDVITPSDKDVITPSESGCIGVSSGCFYYSNRDPGGSYMYVWMLRYNGRDSEWVLMHTISIAVDLVDSPLCRLKRVLYWKNFDCFRPRAFNPKDNVLIIAAPTVVASYNLKTKFLDHLCSLPMLNCNRKSYHLDGNWIFPFSPCLLILPCQSLGEKIIVLH